ncbi:MAG: hypothetical protein C5B50_06210 [Verrucomicrobia bacterium]|nr:MAG: hypothetical protein C5B50_06210 [Verrucomicrobiota bacterium]
MADPRDTGPGVRTAYLSPMCGPYDQGIRIKLFHPKSVDLADTLSGPHGGPWVGGPGGLNGGCWGGGPGGSNGGPCGVETGRLVGSGAVLMLGGDLSLPTARSLAMFLR